MDALGRAAADERRDETIEELRDLIAYLSGLLADFDDGLPDGSRRMAHVCARTMVGQVRKLGIRPKRVFT